MPKEETPQVLKLAYGEVGEWTRLVALFADYADAHVRRLNHVHIVSTVTNCQSCLVLAESSDEADQCSLLLRRWSIDDKTLGLHERINNLLSMLWPSLLLNRLHQKSYGRPAYHQVFTVWLRENLFNQSLLIYRYLNILA